MARHFLLFLYLLLFHAAVVLAQANSFTGTWQMQATSRQGTTPIQLELQIAAPENGILYPAQIKLTYDAFTAVYYLLLVKKNSRELGISKNKFPVYEFPFSLGKTTFFLNGIFDFGRDLKGQPTLSINRIQSTPLAAALADSLHLDKAYQPTALTLISFIKDENIVLTKVNATAWKNKASELIVSPSLSPVYFGIKDTLHLATRDGVLHVSSSKKNDQVSAALNGQAFMEQTILTKKEHTEDILLDTGLNTLVFFADNFSNNLPNKGKLQLEFGKQKIKIDFSDKPDSAASFIIAKLYCDLDKEKDIYFKPYLPDSSVDRPLQANEKILGSIVSTSQQLLLAIWDDAVEDGDSISININGKWIAKGFPVKKNPQFITLSLKPGPNAITFVADNLGSIPPNTSVLEIIDGKRRKSFMLETIMGESNLIKIRYDVKVN